MTNSASAVDDVSVASLAASMRDESFIKSTAPLVESQVEQYAARASAATIETRAGIIDSSDMRFAREAGPAAFQLITDMRSEAQRIRADRELSDVGKQSQLQALQARTAAHIDKQLTVITTATDRIRAGGSPPMFHIERPAAVTADLTLLFLQAPHVPRSYLMQEGMSALQTAANAKTSNEVKVRRNFLIQDGYAPLLERTAISPERWARHLSPLAHDMHTLFRAHLDDVLGTPAWNARVGIVDELTSGVQQLRRMLADPHGDLFLARIAAPLLFPQ